MALYGEARDISFFRYVNRELMGNIISQQCVYYKYVLAETKINMYGEASEGRFFYPPVILNCLIERSDQTSPIQEENVGFNWNITFKFLRDDLLDKNPDTDNLVNNVYGANLVPEVGDIIMYQNGYWEVDNTNANQYFTGKNPDYPNYDDNGDNPLNPGLENYGWNTAVECQAHYVPEDRINLQIARL